MYKAIKAASWDNDSIRKAVSDIGNGIDRDASPEQVYAYLESEIQKLAQTICSDLGVPAWKADGIAKLLLPTAQEFVETLGSLQKRRDSAIAKNGVSLKTKIRNWYHSTYPTDDMWEDIDRNVTFDDVFEALDNYKDIYETIGAEDSLVRERVFKQLAEIMGVDYDYVYDQWMRGA